MDNEGLKSTPGSTNIILSLADLYIQNNLLDQAIELLAGILTDGPESLEVIEKLIEVYLMKGEENEARVLLKKGLEIDNGYVGFDKFRRLIEGEKPAEVAPVEEVVVAETKKEEEELVPAKEEVKEEVQEGTGVDPIKRVMGGLYEINEVLGIILSDETGLLIAENVKVSIDTEGTGALLSSIYSDTVESIQRMNLGSFEYILFDFPRGVVLILASPPLVLTVLCKKSVQTGLLLLKTKGVLEELKNLLGV